MFRGELEAPLVIIGGGLSGVMTAYGAAAAGMRVLLLEADRLGHVPAVAARRAGLPEHPQRRRRGAAEHRMCW